MCFFAAKSWVYISFNRLLHSWYNYQRELKGVIIMADDGYKYDENGFREDLKNDSNVLHQPDADRSAWVLKVLDYDETIAVLNGDTKVKPEFSFSDEVLDKIMKEKPELKTDEDLKNVIKDKDQQILLARYNEDQSTNVTISTKSDEDN